jgi:galactokinase
VLVAFSTQGTTEGLTTIHLANADPKYTPTSFSVDLRGDGNELRSKLGNGEHHWSGYFVAGTIVRLIYVPPSQLILICRPQGILTHVSTLGKPVVSVEVPGNVYILITGSVPPGSGLSSSSAMTTASAIAALSLSGRYSEVARREVTQVAIESGSSLHPFRQNLD